ncbi:hypothetical protein [Niallia nealsonii]|uniref:Uncharacterized protein n=1 Tax=Niallia nealsonii TaxID=115979 RepID=A0A2N0Z6W2_9BACI|nr:hypothetical protein [Niallia nealsonii]PKG25258.1 hypothetical protein CWS01_02580 [Niallia nealsonii]
MYYLLSIGLIILGFLGLFVTIFKYTKEQKNKVKFTGTGQGLDAYIFTNMLNLLPWWIVKIILILSSVIAVFVGIMIILTI